MSILEIHTPKKAILKAPQRALAALTLLAALLGAGGAAAQTHSIVTFPGHVPHTLQTPLTLQGRLVLPTGPGPFPAVVVMHGSGGLWVQPEEPSPSDPLGNMHGPYDLWAEQLAGDEGYAVLFLDSFRPRGLWDFRNQRPPADAAVAPAYERSRDAYDALAYLRGRADIDPDRIALLGLSHGAGGVVGALVDGAAAIAEVGTGQFTVSADGNTWPVPDPPVAPPAGGFSCGVAYYPGAAFFEYYGDADDRSDGFYRPYAPLLMIYGDQDPFWSQFDHPLELRAKARWRGAHGVRGNPLNLAVYLGLDHGFDAFANDVPPSPETAQALDARREAMDFLASCLVDRQPQPASPHGFFGQVLASGDFNGDGKPDLAVGAPWDDPAQRTDAGRVTVLLADRAEELGLPGLGGPAERVLDLRSSALAGTELVGGLFGHGLAAGDFDGDGTDDLAAGLPGWQGGEVYVYYGSSDPAETLSAGRREVLGRDLASIPGSAADGERFGEELTAGDFNGDGFADLAVTLPGADGFRGAVTVVYGGVDGLGTFAVAARELSQGAGGLGETAEAWDGRYMQVASGDFDGDGFADLAVSYPDEDRVAANDGWVAVVRGSATGLTPSGVVSFDQTPLSSTNPESGDRFGKSLAVGDFDADGHDDLVVASSEEDWNSDPDTGIAHVLYGSAAGLSTSGNLLVRAMSWGSSEPTYNTRFADDVAAGDFDGDGADDLALGAVNVEVDGEGGAGRLYVAYGVAGAHGLRTGPTSDPDSPREHRLDRADPRLEDAPRWAAGFGSTLAAADFNGDGADDLAAAARWDAVGEVPQAGSLNVIYGRHIDEGPATQHEHGLSAAGSQFLRPSP